MDPKTLGCHCDECPLRGMSKPVFGTANPKAKLVIVGETPSRADEDSGKPLSGASGYMLDKMLKAHKRKREEFAVTNALLCRPNRKLKPKEWAAAIAACKPRLENEVTGRKTLALGNYALNALTGKSGLNKWYGYPLENVIANFHPMQVLRQPQYGRLFKDIITRALRFGDGALKRYQWPTLITEPGPEMLAALHKLRDDKLPVAIDIENVGQPMKARIRVIGVGNRNVCVAVPVEQSLSNDILWALADVLADERLTKVLHNAEHDLLGLKHNDWIVRGRIDDTLLMHAIVEPQLPHGLAFTTMQYFVLPPWKAVFKAGSDDDDKGDAFWDTVALDRLLTYNAKDCAATAFLYDELTVRLEGVHNGRALYEEQRDLALKACMPMREIGVPIDNAIRQQYREHLVNDMANVAKQFDELVPRSVDNEPIAQLGKTGQSKSLNRLFFEYYNIKPLFFTDEGKPKLDDATLNAIGEGRLTGNQTAQQLAKVIGQYRRPGKLLSTYVDGLPVWDDGRVHSEWRSYGTQTGRWSSKEPNCFSGDTEILTDIGWQRFEDYVQAPRAVAQWEAGRLSYVTPTAVIESFATEMLRLSNTAIDLACTPEHRCLVIGRKTGKAKVVSAANYPSDYKQLHAAEYAWPGALDLSPEQTALLVAIQADGYIAPKNWLDFSFVKARKAERLRALLITLGLPFTETRTDKKYRFYIPKSPLGDKLITLLGPQKLFGAYLLQLSRASAERFAEELWFWDGSAARQNHYASRHKQNADWAQIVLAHLNVKANVRRYVNQRGSVSWQVDVRRRNYTLTTNIERTALTAQPVYCVSVPSGFIVVRRNGKACITGNCQNVPDGRKEYKLSMRGMFVAPPDWYIVGADYSALELRIAALLSGDQALVDDFATNADTHTKTLQYLFKPTPDTPKASISLYRDAAKTIAYGFNYNKSDDVTAVWKTIANKFKAAGVAPPTMAQTKGFRRGWFELHPAILQWQKDTIEAAWKLGYSEAPLSGRRRYFYDGKVDENVALNNPVQATGADITNAAMRQLADRIDWNRAHIYAQIHDAIYLAGPDPHYLADLLLDTMVQKHTLNGRTIEFTIELGIGRNMKELYKLDENKDKFAQKAAKCTDSQLRQVLESCWEHVFVGRRKQ